MAAGTLLRRLLVFVLTVSGIAGLAWLLRKSNAVHPLFRRERWTVAELFARFALIALAASAVANLLGGGVSLADLLMHGTLRSGYTAMAVVFPGAKAVRGTRFSANGSATGADREFADLPQTASSD